MSFPRRLLSTISDTSAKHAASEILERFGTRPISVRKQFLDANQTQLLSLTLGRPNLHRNISIASDAPAPGAPIPPGYHLVYFTPTILESDLGLDGTDQTVNPLSPFTRRMWAGGELEWNQRPECFLKVGQTVQETTRILSAEPKRLKTGDSMILVFVEKSFENEKGVALVDRRSWVFQKEIIEPKQPAPKPTEKPLPEGPHIRDFCQSEVSLFRFSALTFNGHKIHYSKDWCRDVEGHRDCVVHGPLNLINILDLWRDIATGSAPDKVPKSIAYRAMSPLYVGENYRLLLSGGDKGSDAKAGKWDAEIVDSYGRTSMKGTVIE